MSIRVIARILPKRLGSPARKIVAIKLGDVANDDGSKIYPSVATIAAQSELGERQVRRILSDFRKLGLLTVVKEGGGRHRPTEYRMNFDIIDTLPEAKPLSDVDAEPDTRNYDNMTGYEAETLTCTTLNPVTHVTQPVLTRKNLSTREKTASNEAGAEAPQVSAIIWKEALSLFIGLPSPPSRSIVGKWLKQTPADADKEKLLAIVRAARRAGTADPVSYISKALNEACPPPPDPDAFDEPTWRRNVQAAVSRKEWSARWGPPPGKKGCKLPAAMITAELTKALTTRRIAM